MSLYEMHRSTAVHTPSTQGPCVVGYIGKDWYVFNDRTHTCRKIGPVRLSGTNYFDKAMKFAKKKNQEYFEKDMLKALRG